MKSFVVFAAVLAVAAAGSRPLLMSNERLMLAERPELAKQVLTKEGGAQIVDMAFDMDEPGRYLYHFKTNNGIAMMEQAALEKDAGKVQGAYEWTSPEGQNFKLEYVADEFGFHPVAAHLPVAPEVPVAIQRSLQWNAAHPEEDKEADMYLTKKTIMY